jgi:hypothetical protein
MRGFYRLFAVVFHSGERAVLGTRGLLDVVDVVDRGASSRRVRFASFDMISFGP